jgi:hypothetical protein
MHDYCGPITIGNSSSVTTSLAPTAQPAAEEQQGWRGNVRRVDVQYRVKLNSAGRLVD